MSDDWVYVGSYKNTTQYYRKSSVIIDEEKNTIKVLVKYITKIKNIICLQNVYSVEEANCIQFNQQDKWYLFNYKKWEFTITSITDYSKSGKVLLETKYKPNWLHNIFPIKWDDIIPDSIIYNIINKLLQDYKIWNDFQVETGNNNYKLPVKSSNVMTLVHLLIESIATKLSL